MMQRVERHNRTRPPEERVRTSVELEKPREEHLPLMGLGDVVRGRAIRGTGQSYWLGTELGTWPRALGGEGRQ